MKRQNNVIFLVNVKNSVKSWYKFWITILIDWK